MGETLHNDTLYVAVNQYVRESKSTLLWTLKTLHAKKICLVHVHLPFSFTTCSCGLNEIEINAIQESNLKASYESLHKYRDICTSKGVKEEDVDISMISSGHGVGEGIVELIYQNNIEKLVMGAAADPHYSRGMSITSRKAEYVSQHAPHSCKMWFICKGKLIQTREGIFDIGSPSDSFSDFCGCDHKPNNVRRRDEYENESPKQQQQQHYGGIQVNEEGSKKESKEHDNTKGNKKKKKKKKKKEEKSTSHVSNEPHPNFKCPISLEIMKDPHVAADGFTYEGNEIRKWLRGGNETSPITGARLSHHSLTPNFTLRALITDWLQLHPPSS